MFELIKKQGKSGVVVLYGAGNNAKKSIDFMKCEGYADIVCFTDSNADLHYTTLFGYDILPLPVVLKKYNSDSLFFYVTPDGTAKKEIYETLCKAAVEDQQILNCQEWEYKRGCTLLEELCTVSERYLRLCYNYFIHTADEYSMDDYVVYGDPYSEETISAFMRFRQERAKMIAHNFPSPCNECQYIETKVFLRENKIRIVNTQISVSCNLKCVYCTIHDKNPTKENAQKAQHFLVGTFINSLKSAHAMSDKIFLDISSGEFAILTEQQKDDILAVCESYVDRGQILTNAVQYDSKLEYALCKYRDIGMYTVVSLDAGTPETYHAVKGADMFRTVCVNIKRYIKQGCLVRLKYVFLPQNSNKADIDGFINFCLDVKKETGEVLGIALSRDFAAYGDDLGEMLNSIAEMYSRLNSLGFLTYIMEATFTEEQRCQISTMADSYTPPGE